MKWIFAAPLLAALAAPSLAADDVKAEIKTVIKSGVDSVIEVLRDKEIGRDARKAKVRSVVEPLFDLGLIAKLSVGPEHWPSLKKAGKEKEFTELFVEAVQDSYYDKLELFTNETVDFEDPKPGDKGRFQMRTFVNSKNTRYELLYKVYKKDAKWRVYDLEIQGISLIRTFGNQYRPFLEKGQVKELLVAMKKRGDDSKEIAAAEKAKAKE